MKIRIRLLLTGPSIKMMTAAVAASGMRQMLSMLANVQKEPSMWSDWTNI
ncbi:MAG: hypothetical protein OXF48_05915 [Bacteroidetes bacterium]|nr:hypothetical protein [Bacteroidota bacterium]